MNKVRNYHACKWNEPLIMEMGSEGERGILLPEVEQKIIDSVGDIVSQIPESIRRKEPPKIPELSQPQIVRHYLRLSQMTLGLDLTPDISEGTCTMKYSPKVNEYLSRLPHITELHPWQDEETMQGILQIIYDFKNMLSSISGMAEFTFQPGGGSQGIYTNACIIRAYQESKGLGSQKNEIITTAFSHPADAAAPATAGFRIITLMPGEKGYPDVEALKAVVSEKTAGMMITNPEDTGIFNPHIQHFVRIIHEAGGLCAYDQANANGVLGIARAREAGFDLCHFNVHKTFSSPHGSNGPGCGAVGVRKGLEQFLPVPVVTFDGNKYHLDYSRPESIGKVRSFHGNIQAVLRAYAWVISLGAEGLKKVAETCVMNNVYLTKKLLEIKGITIPYKESGQRLEQTRYSFEPLTKDTGVKGSDVRRRVIDFGLQSYHESHYPLITPEPFTLEPTETFSKADLDEYVSVFKHICEEAYSDNKKVIDAPHKGNIGQIDESFLNDPDKWAMTWRAFSRKNKTV
jgi:glycine dehydrogenase subunit 2